MRFPRSTLSTLMIAALLFSGCAATPAPKDEIEVVPDPAGSGAVASTPSTEASPTASAAPIGWELPASWMDDMPPLSGLTVRSTRVAIGVDGVLREATVLVEGSHEPEAAAWIASLPDVPVTTHADFSTASGDTEIRLSSGSTVSGTAGDLPAGWRESMPLGPDGTGYAFAGTIYTVLADGSAPEPPTFDLGFDGVSNVSSYRAWLEEQPGWTVTTLSDRMFTGESADFTVSGMIGSDGTDELTITPLRWDVPGVDALKP
ncbi:hypothetical protein BKA24_000863 [Microbacterium marinum]|uniref:Lipoprotein LprG n=1 Tax=Microbacterium marinum TaxID=421115 RepID=A0A7W7BR33_9MICO|nr:hypothetical protein [Microbacterium marinum]MBB4666154.1 hypothetical protein [Microbacterium marinum]